MIGIIPMWVNAALVDEDDEEYDSEADYDELLGLDEE